jgi:hypothetical protein
LGFIIVLLLTIPMGYFNLDDNMWVQQGAFVVTIGILLQWMAELFYLGLNNAAVPLIGSDQVSTIGASMLALLC